MRMGASSGSLYRDCRRAFIAAAQAAHVDTIARLHPARDIDGKPLFMDSAALGPRLAGRAVMALAADAEGSAIMVRALKDAIPLPDDMRLILIHAPDPAAEAVQEGAGEGQGVGQGEPGGADPTGSMVSYSRSGLHWHESAPTP